MQTLHKSVFCSYHVDRFCKCKNKGSLCLLDLDFVPNSRPCYLSSKQTRFAKHRLMLLDSNSLQSSYNTARATCGNSLSGDLLLSQLIVQLTTLCDWEITHSFYIINYQSGHAAFPKRNKFKQESTRNIMQACAKVGMIFYQIEYIQSYSVWHQLNTSLVPSKPYCRFPDIFIIVENEW